MDMSFSFDDAVPVAAPVLRFADLLALVRDQSGAAGPSSDEVRPATWSAPVRDRTLATTMLADVLLGRPGWREASLALGGCFVGGADLGDTATARSRKPV